MRASMLIPGVLAVGAFVTSFFVSPWVTLILGGIALIWAFIAGGIWASNYLQVEASNTESRSE